MQKAAIGVFLSIGLLKIAGFLKDVLLANYFGIDRNVDIYFYALLFPTILFNLFSASYNSFFIPTYLAMKKEKGNSHARNYTSLSVYGIAIFLLVVIFLMDSILLPWIGQINKSILLSGELQRFLYYSRLASIFAFFYLLSNFLSSLLQAEHKYKQSLYPQMAIPLTISLFIIYNHENRGIVSAIDGMVYGAVVYFIITFLIAYKSKLITVFPKKENIKDFFTNHGQFFILMLVSVSSGFLSFIDQHWASQLGDGKLSILNYGIKIPDMFSEVAGMGLGIATFSHFSQWIIAEKKEEIIIAVQRLIKWSTLLLLPLCFYLILYSEPLVRILFERGAFTSKETLEVSEILKYYASVVYLFIPGIIAARVISGAAKNHLLLIAGGINIVVKIFLNFIFIGLFGLKGIPLSTIGMYIIAICLLYYFLIKEKVFRLDADFIKQWGISFLFVAIVCCSLFLIRRSFIFHNAFLDLTLGFLVLSASCLITLVFNHKFRFMVL